MRIVQMALSVEGATDHRFLEVLLKRLAEDICRHEARYAVEFADIERILPKTPKISGRSTRKNEVIASEIADSCGRFDIVFVHGDGASSPEKVMKDRIHPIQRYAIKQSDREIRIIGVIPVREMEAWCLADGYAVCKSLETTRTPAEIGLPQHPDEVERIPDPKNLLDQCVREAFTRRRSRQPRRSTIYLTLIAENANLATLRKVPQFQRLAEDVRAVLSQLGVVESKVN